MSNLGKEEVREEKKVSVQKIAKFTGSLEADEVLIKMVDVVNDGFNGGRVTKHEMLSWLILKFEKSIFKDLIDEIRNDHFDQLAYLEAVLKEAKRARRQGLAPVDLSSTLSAATLGGRANVAQKRTKKPQLIDPAS
jgi:fatty acid/phospholipid biosynthesis enzyme